MDDAPVEVHVIPRQLAQLAGPEAEGDRQHEQRFEPGVLADATTGKPMWKFLITSIRTEVGDSRTARPDQIDSARLATILNTSRRIAALLGRMKNQ